MGAVDTTRIGRIVEALYASISGRAGAPRDWDTFRRLHLPGARALRTVVDADGRPRAETFDVEGYIANVAPFFAANDFHEIEIAQRVERFGQVAHVWSRYEARPAPESPVLLKRGANSIQLFNDGARWWIAGTVWDNEREGVTFDLW